MGKYYWVGINFWLIITCIVTPKVLFSQVSDWIETLNWKYTETQAISESTDFFNVFHDSITSITTYSVGNGGISEYVHKYFIYADSFHRGIPVGKVIIIDSVNQQIFHYTFRRKAELHGMVTSISFEGDTLAIVKFNKNKKEGQQVIFTDSYTGYKNYANDLLHGPSYIVFNESGIIFSYTNFKNGYEDGIYFGNHKNGMHHSFLLFEKGRVVDGIYYSFYSDGNLKTKREYKNGQIIDEVKYVHDY